ncbi:ribonuclease E/G family protein [Bacteriovorax sp. BSW11_IV]|uniref:Rne/Rng family ribonuclease n=1 Tax=Bacteriovorax sp. BSW11_IV TaxID=1353529 RepID=UPI00038A2DED|nr:Rne/Rng family ribonuclease [Bacteriovorax sp. BSW11_IV]EQC49973.1 ribonuclease E/G family protein [Bacteriovorax sp. BSW11_IV]
MSKDLIINQTLGECRAALLENGEIVDYLMERSSENGENHPHVGNIYKGRVLRVLPGMQSAFIDIGYEKAAFLYVDDAYIPTLDEQREMQEKAKILKEEEDKRKGKVIPDELSTFSDAVDMRFRPEHATIESFLKEGDEVLVQVAKEPISTKGPRVTRHITIAGRHVVYMPFIEHTGVSRRIEDDTERERLKEMLDTIRPEGKGMIARTVAEGQSYKTLKNDYDLLVRIWKEVLKKEGSVKAPSLCHNDLSFIQRLLRDITDESINSIIVDSVDNFKELDKFITKYMPNLKGKVVQYEAEVPLFEKYGVDLEIERALSNKVYLRSGGSLNIDQTEALVSIDVNTGKFVGRKTLEETILRTNLEAVKEIAYQLRLRNCGGLIIIDFIDMEQEEHREMVYNSLLEALKKDRAKTKVLPISELGLVEMTRKRTRDTLTRVMCESCPYCEGTGQVKTTMTVCYELVRELTKVLRKSSGKKVAIFAHPEVTARLCGEDLDLIETLEEAFGKTLQIRSENNYHIEQYEIFPQ